MFTSAPNDVVGGLLSMINDPKAAKAKLEEFQKTTKILEEAAQNSNKASAELATKERELSLREEEVAKHEKATTERSKVLAIREAEVDSMKGIQKTVSEDLSKKTNALALSQNALNDSLANAREKEAELDKRLAEISAREANLKFREGEVGGLKNQLQAKLAQMKTLAEI